MCNTIVVISLTLIKWILTLLCPFSFSALMVPLIYILVLWNHTRNLVPLFIVRHCLLILFIIAFYLFYYHYYYYYYYYYFELHRYQMYNDLLSYHVWPSSFVTIDNQSYFCLHSPLNKSHKNPPSPSATPVSDPLLYMSCIIILGLVHVM